MKPQTKTMPPKKAAPPTPEKAAPRTPTSLECVDLASTMPEDDATVTELASTMPEDDATVTEVANATELAPAIERSPLPWVSDIDWTARMEKRRFVARRDGRRRTVDTSAASSAATIDLVDAHPAQDDDSSYDVELEDEYCKSYSKEEDVKRGWTAYSDPEGEWLYRMGMCKNVGEPDYNAILYNVGCAEEVAQEQKLCDEAGMPWLKRRKVEQTL
jgi:hypothetical protein